MLKHSQLIGCLCCVLFAFLEKVIVDCSRCWVAVGLLVVLREVVGLDLKAITMWAKVIYELLNALIYETLILALNRSFYHFTTR